jgi:transcription elongation factor Elf1
VFLCVLCGEKFCSSISRFPDFPITAIPYFLCALCVLCGKSFCTSISRFPDVLNRWTIFLAAAGRRGAQRDKQMPQRSDQEKA